MKERPILFSAPMVQSNLADIKTQTRRILAAPDSVASFHHWLGVKWERRNVNRLRLDYINCPYGQVGDQLWVRETFYRSGTCVMSYPEDDEPAFCGRSKLQKDIFYAADGKPPIRGVNSWGISPGAAGDRKFIPDSGSHWWRKMPSIHMPRWASRIQLDITNIRVERLQNITEQDAIAEGVERWFVGKEQQPESGWWRDYSYTDEEAAAGYPPLLSAKESYRTLWESINGAGSWDLNPWVWVIEFNQVVRPV